jgi:hypothetical protein
MQGIRNEQVRGRIYAREFADPRLTGMTQNAQDVIGVLMVTAMTQPQPKSALYAGSPTV